MVLTVHWVIVIKFSLNIIIAVVQHKTVKFLFFSSSVLSPLNGKQALKQYYLFIFQFISIFLNKITVKKYLLFKKWFVVIRNPSWLNGIC